MDTDPAPRLPPRFVPTLTEVVQPAFVAPGSLDAGPPAPAPAEAGTDAPSDASARFVPGVPHDAGAGGRSDPMPAAAPGVPPDAGPGPAVPAALLPDVVERLENQIIHRVMQRVDVSLERSLHAAVATMVQQHTHALVPRLREEIEFVVRQAVADAVARELAERGP